MTTSAYSQQVLNHLYAPLVFLDPVSLEYIPFLAESIPKSSIIDTGSIKGYQALEYRIRKEATWDNGKAITAKDYLNTLKIINLKGVNTPIYRAYLSFISDVKIDPDDPRYFHVICKEYYFKAHEITGLQILPKYLYDPTGLLDNYTLEELKSISELDDSLTALVNKINDRYYFSSPEGTLNNGAYRLSEWVPDQKIVLKRKAEWWGDALINENSAFTSKPTTLVFEITNDQNTAVQKLLEGYLDVIGSVDPSNFENLRDQNRTDIKFYTPASAKYYYFGLNTQDEILQSKKLRQALSESIDYDNLIDILLQGNARRIVGPILPDKAYYGKSLSPRSLDLDHARQLLIEDGWKDSDNDDILDKTIKGKKRSLSFEVLVSSGSTLIKDAIQLWGESAAPAGIEILAKPMDFGNLRKELKKQNFQIFGLAAGIDLGLDDLYQQWHTKSIALGSNRSGFGNELTDSLIQVIRSTQNQNERNAAYLEMQEVLHDEQAFIFLFNPLERIIMSQRIKEPTVSAKYPGYFENYFQVIPDAMD